MSSLVEMSRALTVDLPESTAKQVEQIAREENRSTSELIEKALRLYQFKKFEQHLVAVRATLPPTEYTADDVERLVDEVRQEMYEEREAERARRS